MNLDDIRSELTDPTTLRAGINLANILLVTGEDAEGMPVGVAPDMVRALAAKLGVGVQLIPLTTPGDVADALNDDGWDIGLIAIEPKRAETIAFCPPYVEIEATYLVPAGSSLESVEAVDAPGIRIAVPNRTAYDLYLSRTLKHAELVRVDGGLPAAVELFTSENLDALAGLVPALKENAESIPGSRVLPGRYTAVQQAIGTKPENTSLKVFIEDFTANAISDGMVQALIDKHGVTGKLAVANTSD